MPFVNVCREDGAEIAIHFRDRGAGRPIDGYPLGGDSWGAVACT